MAAWRNHVAVVVCWVLMMSTSSSSSNSNSLVDDGNIKRKNNVNAYATMMYVGTARDYEFYVAIRVMLRSLSMLHRVNADLIVIASLDVPLDWIHTLEEDGAKVVRVENLHNPYMSEGSHDRFKLTLNKVYAWSLVEYERVIMLDADNLFLKNTDELFQCGHFCAVFINPCIFHTGLFVLKPSSEVYKKMLQDIEMRRENPDGADQGFLGGYFHDLLDQPMFHPDAAPNNNKLDGTFRLPLGYQMDASYYYLRLRWSVPCGPNSVITFPGASWLKPWYWWSWPVLPLGIQWHQQRLQTLGYDSEMPLVLIQAILYLGVIVAIMSGLADYHQISQLTKLWYRAAGPGDHEYYSEYKLQNKSKRNNSSSRWVVKAKAAVGIISIIISYTLPFLLIPHTIHPVVGWGLYLLGSFALSCIPLKAFRLSMLPLFTPWLGIIGVLLVMACPWYNDGVVRALSVFAYAFCASPVLWVSMGKIGSSLHTKTNTSNSLLLDQRELAPAAAFTLAAHSHGFDKLF